MLNDILFFHRGVQIAPFRGTHCPLLALPSLRIRPPARQQSLPRLRQVQELLKIRQRVVAIVEPAGIAGEAVVVLDAQAIAVDELAESVFLGKLVEVIVCADALEEIADDFRHSIEVGCGFGVVLHIALLRRGTERLVDFPIGLLAFAAAVPRVQTFGTAFERRFCLTTVALATGLLSAIHGREVVNRKR